MFNTIDDRPLTSHNGSILPGSPQIYPLRIDCMAGKSLFADEDELLTIEARADGETDWTDLQDSSLDLTPYAGTRHLFEFRITAASTDRITSAVGNIRIR